ncbi:glycosyltransferase family 2 protein [Georgenia muralis]
MVIPTAGRPQLLLEALESVYAQSCQPREVIVVIDGEPDDRTAMVLGSAFPQVRVIRHPKPRGPSAARNTGIRAATAEWVCFLDDDDIWHHDKQRVFFEYVDTHPECRALRSGFWLWGEPGSPDGAFGLRRELIASTRAELEYMSNQAAERNDLGYLDIEGQSLELMLERNRGVISSTMVQLEVLRATPPVPDDIWTAEDWLLFVNIAKIVEWYLVPGRWIYTRLHATQATRRSRPDRWRTLVTAWTYAWANTGQQRTPWLRAHGKEYAYEARHWIWSAAKRRNWREVREIYRAIRPFLPGGTARLSVLVPPPVHWRLRRLFRSSTRTR